MEQPSVGQLVSNHGAEAKDPRLPTKAESYGHSAGHSYIRLGIVHLLGLDLGILLDVDVVVGLQGINVVIRELDTKRG